MPIMNSGRLIPASSGSSGSSESGISSLMLPLNSVISCNWDSVNNKPDILEIDSEDDTKINLKASSFPIQINFANGLDDDNRPQGLIKNISADQVLDLSSYAGKTVQIVASCDDVESDPTIMMVDTSLVTSGDIVPSDGIGWTFSGGEYGDFYKAFDDNWATYAKIFHSRYFYVTAPWIFFCEKVRVNTGANTFVYLDTIDIKRNEEDDWDEVYASRIALRDIDKSFEINKPAKYFRFKMDSGGSNFRDLYEMEIWGYAVEKYSRAENLVKNKSEETIFQITLGYAIVDATGSVTTLGDYIDLTPNAPGGMRAE